MKRRISALFLTLALLYALALPASAYNMAKAGENNTISAGGSHTGIINKNGSLWMWGSNTDGKLGNGSTTDSSTPIKVMDNVVTVSCGYCHTAAIKSDGSLWAWGYNSNGQLGNGSKGTVNSTPVKVLDDVAAVNCGNFHTAAIKTDGSLWAWGYNSSGQLGNNSTTDSSIPVKVLDNVAAVSCGDGYTAAVKTDGSLWMWGDNYKCQLGNGSHTSSSTPVKVLDNVAAVSCGHEHTAAIKTDGSLWMWGLDDNGQLGVGGSSNVSGNYFYYFLHQAIPVKVMDSVAAVSCGNGHTAAIKTDGSLWMWGNNGSGQLGNGGGGNTTSKFGGIYQTLPVKVLDNAAAVSCGVAYTAAVKTDGSLWTWGYNAYGREAYEVENDDLYQTVPKQVAGLTAKVPATADTPSKSETAMPTNDKLTVNGKLQNPTVYKINGNNYFKIRDLAAILNGTGNQFDVGYDNALKSVTVTTGKGYAKQPGDLAGAATGGSQTAAPSNDTIYINGKKIDAAVYKIGGSNYFKLRDLGDAIGFSVDWSADKGVFIETK